MIKQKLESYLAELGRVAIAFSTGVDSTFLLKKTHDVLSNQAIAEGSNMDDDGDYHPGLQAVSELKVKSSLRYVKLMKNEIRTLSKEKDLPTWNKQSFACLTSRFVYG